MIDATWDEVVARLAGAEIYWLSTTNRSGAPDASPVWGAAVGDSIYLYTFRSSVKARNLAADPRVVLHLESGADVVIVHGRLVDLGHPRESPSVVEAFAAKYIRLEQIEFLPGVNPDFDVLYRLDPQRSLLWTLPDTEASTRRWTRS